MDGAPVVVVLGGAGGASAGGSVPEGSVPGGSVPGGSVPGGRADGDSPAERLAALLDTLPGARLVICDVTALVRPGPGDLDQLGRMRLAARRRGCGLVLRNAGTGLRLLLELTGLDEVFECETASVTAAAEDLATVRAPTAAADRIGPATRAIGPDEDQRD